MAREESRLRSGATVHASVCDDASELLPREPPLVATHTRLPAVMPIHARDISPALLLARSDSALHLRSVWRESRKKGEASFSVYVR